MLSVIQVVVEKLVFPYGAAVEIRDDIKISSGCCCVSKVQRVDKRRSVVDLSRSNVRNRINRVEGTNVLRLPFECEREALSSTVTAKSRYATERTIDKKWGIRRDKTRLLRG